MDDQQKCLECSDPWKTPCRPGHCARRERLHADDLVQRLRERGQGQEMFGFDGMLDDGDPLLIEAANKIVRLRSHILAGLQREASFAEQVEKQDDEIERLSAQLAERDRDAERWRNK